MFGIALLVMTLFLTAMASMTLWWALYAWRTPATLASTGFGTVDADGVAVHVPRGSGVRFSLLLAARHEQAVLAATVHQLLRSDYSDYEVLVIVGHDDPGTSRIAHELAAEAPQRVRVIVDHSEVKTKARALNTALVECTGDVVGVFDAEDVVHPQLLGSVAAAFLDEEADVVQGAVQLMDVRSRWFSLRNCLEYYFWYRSRLHLQAEKGFIPLGGNTVFMKTALLREHDGWDPASLAEDAEIGVRLSSYGAKVVVAYEPELATREETPGTLSGFVKQRTRWNQGFIQVYRKGEWKRLPTFGQRITARFTLGMPVAQGLIFLLIPIAPIAMVFFPTSVVIALVGYLPLVLVVTAMAFDSVALSEFSRQYDLGLGLGRHVQLAVTMPFYMVLLAYAAARAAVRELTARTDWELTEHVGAHLVELTRGTTIDLRDGARTDPGQVAAIRAAR